MKKIVLVLAVLMLAAPVMAEPNHITITAAQVGSTEEVTITYAVTTGKIPRAFALDISVTAGTITAVDGFFVGECNDSNGYGIFPASFAREIDADDPNWADVNYTPVAEPNDLPGGTLGLDPNGITIEMGSLYAAPKGPPENSGKLCSIYVDSSCHVDLALNVGRAGIVMEDGNQPDDITLTECDVTLEVVCTVPYVVDDTNAVAQAAIIAAGFTIGNITTECNDVIADGNVISTNPAAGATPACGSAVDMVVSTGPCACACRGDVTGDGNVSMLDKSLITDWVNAYGAGRPLSIPSTSGYFVLCGDTTGDGKISMLDASKVTDWVNAYGAGRPLSFPCPHSYP